MNYKVDSGGVKCLQKIGPSSETLINQPFPTFFRSGTKKCYPNGYKSGSSGLFLASFSFLNRPQVRFALPRDFAISGLIRADRYPGLRSATRGDTSR
jgi:hypothetical protein